MFSFIETKLFTRLVQEYLTDDEYGKLQWFLAAAPESGPVIPGTGGVRKRQLVLSHTQFDGLQIENFKLPIP